MTKRNNRSIKDVYEQRDQQEQRRQDTIRQLAREEEQARQERDQEQAREQVEEYRENTPRPTGAPVWTASPMPESDTRRSEPTPEEIAHETRRRAFAQVGLVSRTPPPMRPQSEDHEDPAERERRARLGIPAKPKGYGRPPRA